MPYTPRIRIYNTASGFVSPSIECIAYAASIADVDIERAIAEKAQGEALSPGVYIAKWHGSKGGETEYIFTVEVESSYTHHVKVEA